MNFQWKLHLGPAHVAIERMKLHFQRPHYDPREAWFMAPTQRYFSDLHETLTTKEDLQYIENYLFDTGAGLKNFGRFDEWVEWFLFLLPYLLEHILEGNLLCLTINYFLNMYPDEVTEEYAGFREDVLLTLPHAIMATALWEGNDLAKNPQWNYAWEGKAYSPLFATMFFCLKYLKADEIGSWVTSLTSTNGDLWKNLIFQWMKGLKTLAHLAEHPQELPGFTNMEHWHATGSVELLLNAAGINWNESYLVFTGTTSKKTLSDYVPTENIATFWSAVEKHWPPDTKLG